MPASHTITNPISRTPNFSRVLFYRDLYSSFRANNPPEPWDCATAMSHSTMRADPQHRWYSSRVRYSELARSDFRPSYSLRMPDTTKLLKILGRQLGIPIADITKHHNRIPYDMPVGRAKCLFAHIASRFANASRSAASDDINVATSTLRRLALRSEEYCRRDAAYAATFKTVLLQFRQAQTTRLIP